MFNVVMLMGVLTVIFLAIGWFIFGITGMGIALVLAVVINLVSYWYSDKIVLRMYRAKPSEDSKLNHMVEKLAREASIPKPRVYTVHTQVPNAFATGRNPKNSVVAVTDGLLSLDNDEIEGVLAHEIGHIRNRDMLVGTMAATIAGAIAYMAQIGYWSLFMGRDSRGGGNLLGLILVIIFAPLAAMLVRLAISRHNEFKADHFGAVISKKPRSLASALRKISSITRAHPLHGSSATSNLWIVNPFKQDWFTGLFSTHPPIEKRVERLEHMDLGRRS